MQIKTGRHYTEKQMFERCKLRFGRHKQNVLQKQIKIGRYSNANIEANV